MTLQRALLTTGSQALAKVTFLPYAASKQRFSLAGLIQKRFRFAYHSGFRPVKRIPIYKHMYRKGHGWPLMWVVTSTKTSWQPHLEEEYTTVARDEFGVPMQIPPEVSTAIKHVYYVPPQYFPFLKKLGDDTPQLMPYVEKLINGKFDRQDYEEMFYTFAKPLKIYRRQMIMPFRTVEEMTKTPEIEWEGAWLSYRQKVRGEYFVIGVVKDFIICMLCAAYLSFIWIEQGRQMRISMKLFYLEAPEHKINWVTPRGDL